MPLLTDVPARLYGLRDAAGSREGWRADVVVFDAARSAAGRVTRDDLPAGAARLYAEARASSTCS